MCIMTSNVFGAIAAEHLGYAKVELQKTIPKGDPQLPSRRITEAHPPSRRV